MHSWRGALFICIPHSQLRWGHCGGHSLLKREPPPHPRRETRGRSNLAPGPPNGQKGGAAAPPLWIPHPEGRGSGSGKRSWSSPIFARFCNSDSRGRKLMRVLHPARDLACSSSSAWQLSQNRIPKLARRGKFGIKRLFFWRGATVFFSARRKENGGRKGPPSQMAQKSGPLPGRGTKKKHPFVTKLLLTGHDPYVNLTVLRQLIQFIHPANRAYTARRFPMSLAAILGIAATGVLVGVVAAIIARR